LVCTIQQASCQFAQLPNHDDLRYVSSRWEETLSECWVLQSWLINLIPFSGNFCRTWLRYQIIAWRLLGIQYSDCSSYFIDGERLCRGNHFNRNIGISVSSFFSSFMVISRGRGAQRPRREAQRMPRPSLRHFWPTSLLLPPFYFPMDGNCVRLLMAFHGEYLVSADGLSSLGYLCIPWFLSVSSKFLSVLIALFGLIFRTGHLLICHNLRSFLFSASLSFIADEYSKLVFVLLHTGVAGSKRFVVLHGWSFQLYE